MQNIDLPLIGYLADFTPLLWAAGSVLVLFALYLFPLLVCALFCRGRVAANANRQLDRFFDLFHDLIAYLKSRGGRQ